MTNTVTSINKETAKPEWYRPADAKGLWGISRAKCYDLINTGKIKSISLRERGQKTGSRLVSFDSTAAYFNRLSEEQNPPSSK